MTPEKEMTTKSFVFQRNQELDKIQVDITLEDMNTHDKHRIEYEKDEDGEIKQTEHTLPREMHKDQGRANITPDRLTEILIVRRKAQEIAENYIQKL